MVIEVSSGDIITLLREFLNIESIKISRRPHFKSPMVVPSPPSRRYKFSTIERASNKISCSQSTSPPVIPSHPSSYLKAITIEKPPTQLVGFNWDD
jgi:hypothetical protein